MLWAIDKVKLRAPKGGDDNKHLRSPLLGNRTISTAGRPLAEHETRAAERIRNGREIAVVLLRTQQGFTLAMNKDDLWHRAGRDASDRTGENFFTAEAPTVRDAVGSLRSCGPWENTPRWNDRDATRANDDRRFTTE